MKIEKELHAWFWCLGWLLTFTGLTVGLSQKFFIIASTPDCKKEYAPLLNAPASQNGSPWVIALGDSLLQHATPKTQWLGDDVRWLRADIPDGRRELFFEILPVIEKLRPRILLVQDRLLMNRSELGLHIQARRTLRYLASLVLPLGAWQCHKAITSWTGRVRIGDDLLREKETFRQEYTNNMFLSEDAELWLKRFQEQADKVVVIHLPRSIDQSSNTGRREWLDSMHKELIALDIDLVEIGEPLHTEFYRDGAHVNRSGRAVYMGDLGLAIEKLL